MSIQSALLTYLLSIFILCLTLYVKHYSSYVNNLIIQYYSTSLNLDLNYISNPLFEETITKGILVSRGVDVIMAPSGSGKRSSILYVLYKLQKENKIGNVLHVSINSVNNNISLREQLIPFIYLDNTKHISYHLRFEQKMFVIFIDNFQLAQNHPLIRDTIVTFGEDISKHYNLRHGNYKVIVSIDDPYFSANLRSWNGGEKICIMMMDVNKYKWNREQLSQLIKWDIENKPRLLDLAEIAGTPGFLLNTVNTHIQRNIFFEQEHHEIFAKNINNSWNLFNLRFYLG